MRDLDQQLIVEAYSKDKVYYAEFIESGMKGGAIMVRLLDSPPTGSFTDITVTDVKLSPMGKPFYLVHLIRGDGKHRHGADRLAHDSIVRFRWQ